MTVSYIPRSGDYWRAYKRWRLTGAIVAGLSSLDLFLCNNSAVTLTQQQYTISDYFEHNMNFLLLEFNFLATSHSYSSVTSRVWGLGQ